MLQFHLNLEITKGLDELQLWVSTAHTQKLREIFYGLQPHANNHVHLDSQCALLAHYAKVRD